MCFIDVALIERKRVMCTSSISAIVATQGDLTDAEPRILHVAGRVLMLLKTTAAVANALANIRTFVYDIVMRCSLCFLLCQIRTATTLVVQLSSV